MYYTVVQSDDREVIPMKRKEKPKYNLFQCIGFMLRCTRGKWRDVPILAVGLGLLATVQSLTELYLAPEILRLVEQRAPLGTLLGAIGLFTLALVVISALRKFGQERRITGEIDVRMEIMLKINRKKCVTAFPNARNPEIGKLEKAAQIATQGNDEPAEHIWRTLSEVVTNLSGFVLYLLLLSNLDPILMAAVFLTSLVGFFLSLRASRWQHDHRDDWNQHSTELFYLREMAHSNKFAKDIRIFGLAPWLRELREKSLSAYDSFLKKRARKQILGNVADVVLTFLRNGFAYYYLLTLVLEEGLTAADFLLYFTAVGGLTTWVTGTLNQCAVLYKECLSLSQVQEYLNLPEPFCFDGGEEIPKAERYELRLENVTFRYPGTEKNILEQVNLTIAPGEKLAIVGLNGAGKTTLVMLLCGFYDPDEGRVLLNGQDIRTFNRAQYYELFSAVFQEFSILDVTVAQQVAQSATDIDIPRVKQCLEQAGLREFVESLPKGLETHMGRSVYLDGILLSGGQTQRLMLARALYKNGPILVLDEPTAALDPIAENDIYQRYSDMTAGKTSLFISHRLASTRFCDRILYIADGKIAEEGTHESLISMGGEYAKLFDVQSRYYREGGSVDDGEEIG